MVFESFGLTAVQWESLKRGPVHIFTLVAAADSHIDRQEWSAFSDAVVASANHENELVQSLMAALSADLYEAPASTADHERALDGLREIRTIVERLPDGGMVYRSTLIELGATIADASGAQLTRSFAIGGGEPGWTRASGTSAMEREALALAREALGLA